MSDESAAQWRERVLAESQRLKKHLTEAKKRRSRMQEEMNSIDATSAAKAEVPQSVDLKEMEKLKLAQDELSRNTSRFMELKQKAASGDDHDMFYAPLQTYANMPEPVDENVAGEAHDTLGDLVDAQIKLLEFAEKEVEATNTRISQLQIEVASTDDFDDVKTPSSSADASGKDTENSTVGDSSTSSPPTSPRKKKGPLDPTDSYIEDAETTWMRLAKTTSVYQESSTFETARTRRDSNATPVSVAQPLPKASASVFVPQADDDNNKTTSPTLTATSSESTTSTTTPTTTTTETEKRHVVIDDVPKYDDQSKSAATDDQGKKAGEGEFAVPSRPRSKSDTSTAGYSTILSHMQLTSSPLIFFNLACFQGQSEADMEVMHPICGYAVAGKLLAVLGPPGTDTSTLRVALSGMPQEGPRDVLVADFTVASLLTVGDSALRTSEMDPSKSILEILELEDAADVVIGTCIQRGLRSGQNPTQGTPRGSRTPEAPTPRNPHAQSFPGSQAGLHKSVLLMEDLSTLLKADEIFKILRALHRIAVLERASVVVCLNREFERRGLFKLFDDAIVFTEDGVSYFGPSKGLATFCKLIGSPCPDNTHITEHIKIVSNIAAKYHESPIRKHVSEAIEKYTGMKEQELPDTTPRGTIKPIQNKSSKPFMPLLRRKKPRKQKEEQIPDALAGEDGKGMTHGKKLAKRLAEERRKMAENEEAAEKLAVWKQFADLDAKGVKKTRYSTFEHILLDLQQTSPYNRPSCFMNLACFISTEDSVGANINAIQPTVAFASEGCVLGVAGPPGIDASNLLSSLQLGNDANTVVVDLSVRDAIKIAEFVGGSQTEEQNLQQGQGISVHILLAQMMLTACSQEIIGSLIQRKKPGTAAESNIEIGNKILSTSTRSVLILDQILSLDAQSLYVCLKLIRLIAAQARLAVILLIDRTVEQRGLYSLLDTILIFRKEGLFFFGASRHLEDYCRLVDFPCPDNTHIMEHVWSVMDNYNPTDFSNDPEDTRTPYNIRYSCCALAKYNARLIGESTKPVEEGGSLTSRTLLPKFRTRKSSTRDSIRQSQNLQNSGTTTVVDEVVTQAEANRQREFLAKLHEDMQEEKRRQIDRTHEAVWTKMAAEHQEYLSHPSGPLTAGRQSIVAEMSARQTRPSLFFNLASFLPDAQTDRVDVLQPICGFASVGCITGLMGPPSTDLLTFAEALAAADAGTEDPNRPDATKQVITISALLDLVDSQKKDSTSSLRSRTTLCANAPVGFYVRRNIASVQVEQSILVIDGAPSDVPPDIWFDLISMVRKFARRADLTVLMNLRRQGERRGLFALLDDVLMFDENGVSYFGPANRLADYLVLSGLSIPENTHPTDHLFGVMDIFCRNDPNRPFTHTSPAIRFKFSPLAEFVASYTATHTVANQPDYEPVEPEMGMQSKKKTWLPFVGKKKTKKKVLEFEEEAARRRQSIAEAEAEAERQRVAEMEAEMIWKQLVSTQTGQT
eukprot:c12686_g1_i1.p1 GENE.c12686_g1_i1~~c12686_g1_i1.p1  ORF type:complete len:1482 (+),score=399.00 c12686_g1_i1:161-4606(+)